MIIDEECEREKEEQDCRNSGDAENFECMQEEGSDNDGGDESIPPPGPTKDLSGKTPLDVFEELFTADIAENILEETNRYANQYIDSHSEYLELHPRARAHDFVRTPFSIVEIFK